jgi:hypothetical protein
VEEVAVASATAGAIYFPRFDDDPSSSMFLQERLTQTIKFPQ